MIESILQLIVSVSMLTALPTASIIQEALWGFGQLFPFSEFFDNPGQSLIQSAEDLLSWCRKGRYQCPPRKEPPDTRVHRVTRCERSVGADRFPRTQASRREDGVNCAERPVDQIHNLSVWRAVQRESLNRWDETSEQAGKKGENGEWKMRPPPLSAKGRKTITSVWLIKKLLPYSSSCASSSSVWHT